MTRRMGLVTRVACDEEGDDDGYKSNGDKGDRRATATRAMVTAMATAKAMTWVMVMVTRLAGNKEGKGEGGKGDGDDDGNSNSSGNKGNNGGSGGGSHRCRHHRHCCGRCHHRSQQPPSSPLPWLPLSQL